MTEILEGFIEDSGITQQLFMMKIGNKIAQFGAENLTPEENLEMSMKLFSFLHSTIEDYHTLEIEELFLLMDGDVRELMERALLAVIEEFEPIKELTLEEHKFLGDIAAAIDGIYLSFKEHLPKDKQYRIGVKKEMVKKEVYNSYLAFREREKKNGGSNKKN